MSDWEQRLADLWASMDDLPEAAFVTRMEQRYQRSVANYARLLVEPDDDGPG